MLDAEHGKIIFDDKHRNGLPHRQHDRARDSFPMMVHPMVAFLAIKRTANLEQELIEFSPMNC